MDTSQAFKMRWILFWVLVTLYVVIVIATLLVVFAGIGRPEQQERSLLFKLFIGEIGVTVIALFYALFGIKRSQSDIVSGGFKIETTPTKDGGDSISDSVDKVCKQVVDAGLTRFTPSREFYAIYRSDAPSIDTYINTAKRSIVIISVNLMTGLPFDGVLEVLESRLEDRVNPVDVTISLLNPKRDDLMSALAPVLQMSDDEFRAKIIKTLDQLYNFKARLSTGAQRRFKMLVHNAIPFASAILLDHEEEYGRIQIETKPYKAPLRKSFGFEVAPTTDENLYDTLRQSYEDLLRDGTDV